MDGFAGSMGFQPMSSFFWQKNDSWYNCPLAAHVQRRHGQDGHATLRARPACLRSAIEKVAIRPAMLYTQPIWQSPFGESHGA